MKKIKIGAITYELEYVQNLKNDKGTDLFGQILYDDQIIQISTGLKPDREFTVLWHEVVHGICDQFQLDLTESQVATMAVVIVEILKNNPNLRERK